jgi:hypothetical protein
MAVERNPFANVINLNADPMEEAVEFEIELEDEDGELIVEDMMEEAPYDHYANLIYELDEDDLTDIASKVIEDYEADKESRADWEDTFERGFDLLGLKLQESSEPFEGACTAVHPLIIESSVKFQSKAIQELFPAKGPVKAQLFGNPTPEKEKQANRVQNFMNYQLTDQMPEYFDELERMLFHLPVFGSAFKKVYYDPALERPVSEFVTIDQFVVSNNASDLRKADRYTHVIYRSPNDLKRDIVNGFYGLPDYTDDKLPEPTEVNPTSLRMKMDNILGMDPDYSSDPQYTLLEHHCYLEIESEDDEDEIVVALPYIVTINLDSRTVLSIRRNWREDDARKEKLCWFTHYKFVPGFGFYGLGYIHFLGNLTASATAAMRNLIDAGQFANLPGGFKARGVRVVGANDPIAPGEFREVEATGVDLGKAIIPLPYKEPSNTLMQMLNFVASTGQKFADTTEQVVADSTNAGPVGTTLALLEASTKFFSAIHKRLHHSQRDEFQILARINYDFLPNEYPYDIPMITGQIFKSDFDGRVDIVPVSDPNVPSSAHRIAMAQTVMQLAAQSPPGMYNMKEVNRTILDALNVAEPNRFLTPDPPQAQPLDPVSDIRQAVQGMPIKAFPGQDHKAHITVKQSFIADPTLGQTPLMQQVVPVLQANIREHMIMQYEEEMAGMLEAGVQEAGATDESAISVITQGAAQEILENNQRMAEMGSVEDIERMSMELQRQQLELEKEKVKLDALQSASKIALEEEKLDLNRDELAVSSAEKVAKIRSENMNKQQDREEDRMERDDKFLVEVMKVLMKETGTSVAKLKETVDLTPKFSEGGDVDKFGALLEQMMRQEGDDPGFERDTTGPPEIDTSMPSTDMPSIEVIKEMMTAPPDTSIKNVGFPVTTGRERPELVTSVPKGTEAVTEPEVTIEEEKEFSLADVTPPPTPVRLSPAEREKLKPKEIDAGTYLKLTEEIKPKTTSQDEFFEWMEAIRMNESSGSHFYRKGEKIPKGKKVGDVKVSKAGAIGEYQLTPVKKGQVKFGTFSPTKEMLQSPEYNRYAGHTYGAYLLDKFKGNKIDAAIAYNWGEGNTREWIKKGRNPKKLPSETRGYLKKLKAQVNIDDTDVV